MDQPKQMCPYHNCEREGILALRGRPGSEILRAALLPGGQQDRADQPRDGQDPRGAAT